MLQQQPSLFWEDFAQEVAGISTTGALVRSGTDIGRKGKVHGQWSNPSQRFSLGLRSGLCRPAKFFHAKLKLLLWISLQAWGHYDGETVKCPKLLPQSSNTKQALKNPLYAAILTFHLI